MEPSIIQQNGYVWIALPREEIVPFTLLEETKVGLLKRIKNFITSSPSSADVLHANIFSLFPKPGRGKVPKASAPKDAAFFKGHDILNVKSDVAVKTLEQLSAIAKGSVSGKLQLSTKLLFSFTDVKQIHVDNEILFREYISISKPIVQSEEIISQLQKGKIFVVSDILQTTEFSVRDASDFDISGNIQAEAIEKFASLKASLSTEKDSDSKLYYNQEGKPITFALKAYRILYKDGKYSLSKTTLKSVRGEQKQEDMDVLQSEDGLVWIE